MSEASTTPNEPELPTPANSWSADLLSGFLVFLIALPLCLGIAKASQFPPIAGVWTAIVGGIICTFISNSPLTIKGPAAGMIVIVLGSVTDLGAEALPALAEETVQKLQAEGKSEEQIKAELQKEQFKAGYRPALAVGAIAGILQILFGLLKAGTLGDFFPMTAVHGLLASIGIIIMFKQLYVVIGTAAPGGAALDSVLQFPEAIPHAIQNITVVGLTSLAILIALSLVKGGIIKKIPAQVFVLVVAIPLGYALSLGPKVLVEIPDVLGDPSSAFALPDFSRIMTSTAINYIVLYSLIGSLESLVSAKAVDLIDPWKRKTDLNRDIAAVGVANTVCATVGALPMISEIVRSKANIDNGGRTRFADLYHSLFLLIAVVFFAFAIRLIPLAALAAMLVYTGFRLAHPRQFVHAYHTGIDQLIVFLATIVGTLATDLLKGIGIGVAVELIFVLIRGASPASLFSADVIVSTREDGAAVMAVKGSAVFTNWIQLRAKIVKLEARHVVLDLTAAKVIDHTVTEKLTELQHDFHDEGRLLEVVGLRKH